MSESPVDIISSAGDGRPEAAASAPPTTPGAVLAATREGHGLTIEQVASHLNLAPRQVLALEADDFAALPGTAVARGFLRSYAKLLRLDPAALVAMIGEQHQPASSAPMRHALSGAFSESRLPSHASSGGRSRSLPIAIGIAVLVVAAAGSYALGWWPETLSRRVVQFRLSALSDAADGSTEAGSAAASGEDNRIDASADVASRDAGQQSGPTTAAGVAVLTPTTTLSIPTAGASRLKGRSNVAPAVGNNSAAATGGAGPMPSLTPSSGLSLPRPTPAGIEPAAKNPLVLTIQEDSWIELKRADNTPVISKVIRAGTVETFDVSEPLTLTVGNIAGVEARLRGAPIALASAATGNVARIQLK